MQYQYSIYDCHRTGWESVQGQLDAMAADGWEIHTSGLNFSELAILWHRDPLRARGPVLLDTGAR